MPGDTESISTLHAHITWVYGTGFTAGAAHNARNGPTSEAGHREGTTEEVEMRLCSSSLTLAIGSLADPHRKMVKKTLSAI